MTNRRWKFSQIVSLALVTAIFALGLVGGLGGGKRALFADSVVAEATL